MTRLLGSCLCGAVGYGLSAEIVSTVNCHCAFCRSHSGAAFSTYVVVPYQAFEIATGEGQIGVFRAGAGKKHFCRACGTPLFNLNDRYPGMCMVYLGTLKDHDGIGPGVNIWCESKLAWVDLIGSIPSLARDVESR